ncbi:MAG: spore germination protein GerW family protein [Negativicutes bacterium]|nr:spore germination protein GerW family protein [Negativicutes bacterium]
MAQDSMQSLISSTLSSMRGVMDTRTIIGDAIVAPDKTVILPVAKIALGFGLGGHAQGRHEGNFAGGAGGAATVKPVGFLVCTPDSGVRFLSVDSGSNLPDRIIDLMPSVIAKIQELVRQVCGSDGNGSNADNDSDCSFGGKKDGGVAEDSSD